ncbi:hypothetical protein VTP01DRAFT_1928 [Rhizomucor pusillus]|uniref:uncharacterized protein n=1 Tax=Rhizomucor pusillus TaxID=4840 RepID=UPI003741F43D
MTERCNTSLTNSKDTCMLPPDIFADKKETIETLEALLSLAAECGDDHDYYYYHDHFRHGKRRRHDNVDAQFSAQEGSTASQDSDEDDDDDYLVDGYWTEEEYLAIKVYYENEEHVDRDVMAVFTHGFHKVMEQRETSTAKRAAAKQQQTLSATTMQDD